MLAVSSMGSTKKSTQWWFHLFFSPATGSRLTAAATPLWMHAIQNISRHSTAVRVRGWPRVVSTAVVGGRHSTITLLEHLAAAGTMKANVESQREGSCIHMMGLNANESSVFYRIYR